MDVPFRPFVPARILFQLLLLTIPLIVMGGTAALAQTTASIKGTVTDSSGSAVAGAKIIVKSQGLGIERTTQSNSSGDYEVPALPPGTYSVEVQMQGFSGEIHDQRRQLERHVAKPSDLPADYQHRVRVQDRQLDLQRGVWPEFRIDRQHCHAFGIRSVPRRGLRLFS